MCFRDYESMTRVYRTNVEERDHAFVFIHLKRRQFPADYLAKDTVGHNFSITCPIAVLQSFLWKSPHSFVHFLRGVVSNPTNISHYFLILITSVIRTIPFFSRE